MSSNQRNEIEIPTKQLKLGMRVIRLDRPWLETDFLIQGFIIKDPSQIRRLTKQCNFVVIETTTTKIPIIQERRKRNQGLFARLLKNRPEGGR